MDHRRRMRTRLNHLSLISLTLLCLCELVRIVYYAGSGSFWGTPGIWEHDQDYAKKKNTET